MDSGYVGKAQVITRSPGHSMLSVSCSYYTPDSSTVSQCVFRIRGGFKTLEILSPEFTLGFSRAYPPKRNNILLLTILHDLNILQHHICLSMKWLGPCRTLSPKPSTLYYNSHPAHESRSDPTSSTTKLYLTSPVGLGLRA